jgi:hypothetical protein
MEDEEIQDAALSSKEQEEVDLDTTKSDESEEDTSESVESLKAQLAKKDEIINNQKIRAEKAEGKLKSVKTEAPQTKSTKQGDLGSKDLYALMEAKVPQDDVDEVVEYAKFKGITVAEALKTSFVKVTLSEKSEQRRIADATNVGNTRRTSSKASEDTILSKASAGEMPDSDEDLMRLILARKAVKK